MRTLTLLIVSLGATVASAAPDTAALTDDPSLAVRVGDCHVFERQPAAAPRMPLAAARCSVALGRPQAAAALLDSVPAGPLDPWVALVRAEAELALGDPKAAITALDSARPPGQAGRSAALLHAEALAATGAYEAAVARLRESVSGKQGHRVREALAIILRTRDAAAATREDELLWRTAAPEQADARAAARIGADFPDLTKANDRALALERVTALGKALRHDEAWALRIAIDAAGPSNAQIAPSAAASLAAKARDYPAAVAYGAAALGSPDAAKGSPNALFDYALAHARQGDYATAATIYARLEQQHPASDEAEQARFKRGYMAWDAGDCAAATPMLTAFIKQHPRSSQLDEALWFVSRCQARAGDWAAMSDTLARLAAERPKSSLVPGAKYWQARALGELGDQQAERAALSEVLAAYPVSGWSWFAAQRLARELPRAAPPQRPAWPASMANDRSVRAADLLLAQGLASWARDALADAKISATTDAERLALGHAWLAAGDARRAREQVASRCRPSWLELPASLRVLCTPRPEQAAVEAARRGSGLPDWLPYAIMQAESALDPSVTSIAGARGLMQLMPKEAARLHAQRFPDRPFNPDDLYDAAYNATLGTLELARAYALFDGALTAQREPAVIASYNAGVEPVQRWLGADADALAADVWAEDVSFTETRRYVKRVLGFGMAQRWAWGDQP